MQISVLSWLEKSSAAFPDRVVYEDDDQTMTFGQLKRTADSIGTFIAGCQAPASPVVVMTGRHVLTPAAYLGVVSAGCFYVPMDASMPAARLNQILSVMQAHLMITDNEHREKAESLEFSGKIVNLEEIISENADPALLEKARFGLTEYSPLYVIFTSGSTGRPKGVITSHYSLMCYIDAVSEVLALDQEDILGNQSPLDYIAAVRDIYLPLLTGARTYIIPKTIFAMPEKLFEALNAHHVTTLCWSTAGVELPARLNAFDTVKPRCLKRLLFSGSVISSKYLRVWQQHLPDIRLINQYGPTESTASCTYYEVSGEVTEDTVLPIGRPYKHYGILLLSEDGQAVPEGEIGEICVTGPCLALGYYGNAEKTAQSFIQNPLNSNYRELIYKTGDLGRIGEDGLLMFCGRKDRQIKHMGHRIELEEIEGTAMKIAGVEDCCALYHKEKQLLYLFYTGEASSRDIAVYFRENMPSFMVPRKMKQLSEMPHLPNGKKDMQALTKLFK